MFLSSLAVGKIKETLFCLRCRLVAHLLVPRLASVVLERQKPFFYAFKNHQAGFSMLEVLISLVVFSIGFLALASLQTTGVRITHDATLMGQASVLTHSLADRLRVSGPFVDISDWQQQVKSVLPAGEGRLLKNKRQHSILLTWRESSDSHRPDSLQKYLLELYL
jgi:type IV pilus assembly protein PilV